MSTSSVVSVDATETFATPRMASGALIHDEAGRVMLLSAPYKTYADLPGGYIERGESPREACRREVREELGVALPVGQLLVVDWAPTDREGDKVLYVYDGGQVVDAEAAAFHLDPVEVSGYRFYTLDELGAATIPRLARRIHYADRAWREGTTVELEHGEAVTYGPG